LGGDEARLLLQDRRIIPPRLEKGLLVGFIQREDVHQHDGSYINRELTFDRESKVQWAQQRHNRLCSLLIYDVNSV